MREFGIDRLACVGWMLPAALYAQLYAIDSILEACLTSACYDCLPLVSAEFVWLRLCHMHSRLRFKGGPSAHAIACILLLYSIILALVGNLCQKTQTGRLNVRSHQGCRRACPTATESFADVPAANRLSVWELSVTRHSPNRKTVHDASANKRLICNPL